MESINENDIPPSPTYEESENEGGSPSDLNASEEGIDEEEDTTIKNNNVSLILQQLQSSGALIRKPKEEFLCHTCKEEYTKWDDFENHLLQHVSQPVVLLDRLSDIESDTAQSGDENWSDEEETQDPPQASPNTPQKIDISQILQKTGISIKRPTHTMKPAESALSKLSGLGFTIKKNVSPIKQEKIEPEAKKTNNDVMQKLGQLGGIKLKLKSEGSNNSFKVVNGLQDFKTSDDEGSGNEDEYRSGEDQDDNSDEESEIPEKEKSTCERQSVESISGNNLNTDDNLPSNTSNLNKTVEPLKILMPALVKSTQLKTAGRPSIKLTPRKTQEVSQSSNEKGRRNSNAKEHSQPTNETERRASLTQELSETQFNKISSQVPMHSNKMTSRITPQTTPPKSPEETNMVIKKEIDSEPSTQPPMTMLSNVVKTERQSPQPASNVTTPILDTIKTEKDSAGIQTHTLPSNQVMPNLQPLMPVTKQEAITIIEINGDSNDEDDDDCCVVASTPATDVKPIIPKIENVIYPSPTSFPSSQSSHTSTPPTILSSRLLTSSSANSTEKQHNFNWNAPDTKPIFDTIEKSADDIFESLFSSTKKENLSDASEYISLDRLGPQHSCDICNTRFTDMSLLEDHIRTTGHSKSIVTPSASTLIPYNQSSNPLLSSLFPVKQLAEQVGKLSTIGHGGQGTFSHQQNVMINIQTFPGSGGGMMPPSNYGTYGPGHSIPPGYQPTNPMYAPPGQPIPGQTYPSSQYVNQQSYAQNPYQMPMSKPGYPNTVPTSTYATASGPMPYSAQTPLQSMQQAVYGQPTAGMMNTAPGMMNTTPGQSMGPMGQPSPGQQFVPPSSPGMMKPPTATSAIKIQNVQTFGPGQLGTPMSGSPGQIRMSNPTISGSRPRMPGIRAGTRPTIRPGIQVHGQSVRGGKAGGPRMPLKRPGMTPVGPPPKRRDMLTPSKHDNEDCQIRSIQKQRDGLPMIHSVQGAKDKLNLGSQISVTKKTVNKEANAMANVLASRGIMVKQKQKSRSPSPDRPIPHIPNLGAGVSIKHTSKSSSFSIPEAKVGGGMLSCKICKKMFMNHNSLSVHMNVAHPQSKIPVFKCDECPASYPKSLQLQHHKRVFHNVTGPNRELGLPVVDLSQEDNLKRLSSLGIYSFIPLANREQASGCFGIPVISVHNASNGMTNSLQALGADGLLSLGPLKPLPNT